jgi:hypothetical protein
MRLITAMTGRTNLPAGDVGRHGREAKFSA